MRCIILLVTGLMLSGCLAHSIQDVSLSTSGAVVGSIVGGTPGSAVGSAVGAVTSVVLDPLGGIEQETEEAKEEGYEEGYQVGIKVDPSTAKLDLILDVVKEFGWWLLLFVIIPWLFLPSLKQMILMLFRR